MGYWGNVFNGILVSILEVGIKLSFENENY